MTTTFAPRVSQLQQTAARVVTYLAPEASYHEYVERYCNTCEEIAPVALADQGNWDVDDDGAGVYLCGFCQYVDIDATPQLEWEIARCFWEGGMTDFDDIKAVTDRLVAAA